MRLLPFIVSEQWPEQNVQCEGHSFTVKGQKYHYSTQITCTVDLPWKYEAVAIYGFWAKA